MSLAAFDLEIAKIIPENADDLLAYSPLGISCAGLAFEDNTETPFWQAFPQLSKDQCRKLVQTLMEYVSSGYTLLTWNGCNFDFRVLAQESGMISECGRLALNHVDLMLMVTFTKGWLLGLDKALSGAGISGKVKEVRLSNGESVAIRGALVPGLWAKREFEAVLTYLGTDVTQTLKLGKTIQTTHTIRWVSSAGKPQSVSVPRLLTVKECFGLPLPDTSWMTKPPKRETFVDWIPDWGHQIQSA